METKVKETKVKEPKAWFYTKGQRRRLFKCEKPKKLSKAGEWLMRTGGLDMEVNWDAVYGR